MLLSTSYKCFKIYFSSSTIKMCLYNSYDWHLNFFSTTTTTQVIAGIKKEGMDTSSKNNISGSFKGHYSKTEYHSKE